MEKANEIVSEIRNQMPPDITDMQEHPDKEYQTESIQNLLDKDINVITVNKPIIEHENKIIELRSYMVMGKLEDIPDSAHTVFIWNWYKMVPPPQTDMVRPFGKILLKEEIEIIRMAWI